MSFYANIGKTVLQTISTYGQPITIKRLTTTLGTTVGVFTESEETNISGDSGSNITATNTVQKQLYVPGNIAFDIDNGDIVYCAQGTFKVKQVDEVNPAGTRLLYKLMVT